MSPGNANHSNHLLAALAPEDFKRLQPHLEAFELKLREMLESPNQPIASICFPLSGIVSIVARTPKHQLEVGIVGREGMTGVSVLLGTDSSPHECYTQVPGEGLRINTAEFKLALAERPSLSVHLLSYGRLLLLQTAQKLWQTAAVQSRSGWLEHGAK
jgi:CRP-like cAMP-binding protein